MIDVDLSQRLSDLAELLAQHPELELGPAISITNYSWALVIRMHKEDDLFPHPALQSWAAAMGADVAAGQVFVSHGVLCQALEVRNDWLSVDLYADVEGPVPPPAATR